VSTGLSCPSTELTRLLALGAALLSACSLAPAYRPPPPPQVAQYREAGEWAPAPAASLAQGPWWQAFADPELDRLEGELTASNPSLAAALARFSQARAFALGARSNVFPSVDARASGTRARTSGNAPLGALLGGRSYTANDYLLGLDMSWEIDLFGRLRNAAAAAGDRAQASAADAAALELSVRASLASDYFSLRGDDAGIALLEDTVKSYASAYTHTAERYKTGIAAQSDVDQAATQLENARAQLAAVRLDRAQLEHAIAVLTGQVPSLFSLGPGALAAAPPPVDAGLPSTLLLRRPDVASAERAMAAANAQIGVARAAWFPNFSLAGAAGFESIAASSWLSAPSQYWSVGPAGQLPLIDFGARLAGTRQAHGVYEEAVANYRQTTLTAFQEVEDSLAALHHLSDELTADQAAARAAGSAAFHSLKRYDAGVADYLEVTSTETASLQAQRAVIATRVARLNAAVALVRATGGGWSRTDLDGGPAAVSRTVLR